MLIRRIKNWLVWSPAEWLYRCNLERFPLPRLPFGWPGFLVLATILIIAIDFVPPLPIEPTFPRPITATIWLAFHLLFFQVKLPAQRAGLLKVNGNGSRVTKAEPESTS
jgi:hypothetical protein